MKKDALNIMYHIAVVVLSAAIALSLSDITRYLTRKVLLYWSLIENQEVFLVSTEIATAILLIVLINAVVQSVRVRKFFRMARTAGIAAVAPPAAFLARRKIKRLKKEQGSGRN